jgi:UDPglucose 6-dehydrogenase
MVHFAHGSGNSSATSKRFREQLSRAKDRLGCLNDNAMRITVIGTGYVGTVTGACLSYLGHYVSCVDSDASKIEKLRCGESPIYEPHLEKMLKLASQRGGIEFTTDLTDAVAHSEVIFIAVGTPPLPTGEAATS